MQKDSRSWNIYMVAKSYSNVGKFPMLHKHGKNSQAWEINPTLASFSTL